MLLDAWEDRINAFLQRFHWLGDLSFYARSPDGKLVVLRGKVPRCVVDPVTLGRDLNEDEVIVVRRDRCMVIWPLVRYGIPWVSTQNLLPRDTVVEIYARRSNVEGFHYTPIGLRLAYWSSSRANATARFMEMFPPGAATGSNLRSNDAAESFRREISKDAKLFVGRQNVLEQVLDLVRAPPRTPIPLLWLSGTAGIGKSILVAKVAHRLVAEAKESSGAKLRIVPYRFRRGDPRCSREQFFMLASRSISRTNKTAGLGDYKSEALHRALTVLPRDVKCIFVLDGIDEIDELDPAFLSDVCIKLAHEFADRGNVTWFLAGRAHSRNSLLTQRLKDAGADDIFRDGLEKMTDEDIRAILLDQTGPARNALLLNDTTTRTELFPLPSSREFTTQLDAGIVPAAVFTKLAGKGYELSASARSYPIRQRTQPGAGDKGAKSTSWLVDDTRGKMYYIERGPLDLQVCSDKVDSEFVDLVTKRSEGLPLYVRYVVLDILAGRLVKLDGREPLPEGLTAYYRQLLKQQDIGVEQTLLTPVLCLIAIAKEPLSKEQILLRLRSYLSETASADDWFETVILKLSTMLRGGTDGQTGNSYSLYHHSLRQHLEEDAATSDSVKLAQEWLVSRACACASLEEAGPFAVYFARHGVVHLLEANKIAEAVKLLDHLKTRADRQTSFPRGYLSSVTSRKVGLALHNWLEERTSDKLSDAERKARDAAARAMSPRALANIIFDTYETGIYSGVLRILIEFNYEEWWRPNKEGIRDRFITPYDMVAKHTVGEALSDVFQIASVPRRRKLMAEIKAKALGKNIEERETAGYALQEIFIANPDLIDSDVISRWSGSETNIERMILGELLVSLAHDKKGEIVSLIHGDVFWNPIWENNAIDIDDFKVLTEKHLTDGAANPRLLKCASEHDETTKLLNRLLADPYVNGNGSGGEDQPLLTLLKAYDKLAAGDPRVRNAFPALLAALKKNAETRRVAKDIIKVLFSHSLWAVAEAATSVVADLAQEDIAHLSLIDELLDERDAYWRVRYGTVDAAFNVRELDDYKRLRRALRDNFAHANSRVRGICFDEFFAWVRLAEQEQRDAILQEFEPQLRHAIEHASDCWELEYIYLLFSFLDRNGAEVKTGSKAKKGSKAKEWLGPDQQYSTYLGNSEVKPFYKLSREAFLLRIDSIRREELRARHVEYVDDAQT
ncbi:ATP-binding protein [Caballeronia sp. SBC1]|uniref:ATP-binding protein n=2 Tax=unclassified Caballeronia TaxID=2646786 RepID=UPI001A9FD3D9|nr:ATP-binding protein [Caballeronia sp. SBC1]